MIKSNETTSFSTSSSSSSSSSISPSSYVKREDSLQSSSSSSLSSSFDHRTLSNRSMNMANKIGHRHLIAILSLCSAMMIYIGRINLSTAIVEMSNDDNDDNDLGNHSTVIINDVCPYLSDSSNRTIVNSTHFYTSTAKKFNWNQKTQGVILGAFFYGYFALQIVQGRLAESFGPRILCTVGLLATGIINLLTPVLADYYGLFVASRIILGAFQAAIYPSCYAIASRWIPDHERSTVNSMTFIGGNIGTMVASFIAGFLAKHGFAGGWPSIFYVSGILITIFSIIYLILVRDDPSNHWMVTNKELNYITANIKCNNKKKDDHQQPVPWRRIFTNRIIWAGIFNHFTQIWSLTVIVLKLPDYMHHVLRMPLEKNGMFTSVMYLSESFSLFTGGLIADRIIKMERFDKTMIRKTFQSLSQFGGAACLLLIPMANCNANLFLMVIIGYALLHGLQSGGCIPLPSDLSNEYSATIFSIFNMVGMTNGFICPMVIGYILDYDVHHTKHQWWIILYFTAGLRVAGGLIFLLFISASRQNWHQPSSSKTAFDNNPLKP